MSPTAEAVMTTEHESKTINLTPDFGVRCVSDHYDADGRVTYADAGDFLAMCQEVFGEQPCLVRRADGWHDDRGLVLVVGGVR